MGGEVFVEEDGERRMVTGVLIVAQQQLVF
jgi:hypothetical protein